LHESRFLRPIAAHFIEMPEIPGSFLAQPRSFAAGVNRELTDRSGTRATIAFRGMFSRF